MARHKNAEWVLAEDINSEGKLSGLARRQVAVLMDIRDELQTLNTLLGCRNFTGIPATLRAIQRNTKKEPK